MANNDAVVLDDALVNHVQVRPGAWSSLAGGTAEVLARSGAAWVVLDAQHGRYSQESLTGTLLELGSSPVPVFVRVPDDAAAGIGRVLDCGAAGVIVPLVNGAEQAAAVAAACRYPPPGQRSWGSISGLLGRAAPLAGDANDAVMCAVMVETAAGLDEVEAIAATAGIDMVFVGPFDLSLALGLDVDQLLGNTSGDSPLARVVQACARAGIRAGAFGGSPARARVLAGFGFTDIVVITDAALLADAASAEMGRWTATVGQRPGAGGAY